MATAALLSVGFHYTDPCELVSRLSARAMDDDDEDEEEEDDDEELRAYNEERGLCPICGESWCRSAH